MPNVSPPGALSPIKGGGLIQRSKFSRLQSHVARNIERALST